MYQCGSCQDLCSGQVWAEPAQIINEFQYFQPACTPAYQQMDATWGPETEWNTGKNIHDRETGKVLYPHDIFFLTRNHTATEVGLGFLCSLRYI